MTAKMLGLAIAAIVGFFALCLFVYSLLSRIERRRFQKMREQVARRTA